MMSLLILYRHISAINEGLGHKMPTTHDKLAPVFIRILLLVSLFISIPTQADTTVTGKVVKVADGDTLTLRIKNKRLKIRLAEIDTPEKAQAYGMLAREALVDKVMGKLINVRITTTDRYKRSIGHIYLNNRHINAEMIKEGHAWVYRNYLKDRSLLAIEKQARLAKRGLWALPISERQAPWEWRKARRNSNKIKSKPTQTVAKGCISNKRYCKHMTNCNEAIFYLNQCHRKNMDGDNDGIPCETTHCRTMTK